MASRKDFDANIFDRNPLAGKTPRAVYREIRWGNSHTEEWSIDAPEPLVCLGILARLDFAGKRRAEKHADERGPFVCVGTKTNYIYLVPRGRDGGPIDRVARGPYVPVEAVKRIDYVSVKGDDEAYYYHHFERPYPHCCKGPGNVRLLAPAVYRNRRTGNGHARSYAVKAEGIIG